MVTELNYDFIEVGNGMDYDDMTTRVVRTSGNVIPVDFVSTSNVAWVKFTSDRTKTAPGFGMELVETDTPGMYIFFSILFKSYSLIGGSCLYYGHVSLCDWQSSCS